MKRYERHNRWDIFVHWHNAFFWIALLVTGLGLIRPEHNPLGAAFPTALRSLFGGGGDLLLVHQGLGLAWLAGLTAYLAFNGRGARFFLAEVFRMDLARDLGWMVRKMVLMTLGEKPLRALGLDPALPPQGFYNMGQKAFAQVAVVLGLGLAATGLVMLRSQTGLDADPTAVVTWAILAHLVFAGLTTAGLLVHVYMAAISPEERPGLRSMFTGSVPEDYARRHHGLWWEKVRDRAPGPDGAVPLFPERK